MSSTNKFIGDRLFSTFCHEMVYMDGNSAKGYSKHKYHDEAKDKEYLLTNYISRIIASNNYIDKCQYIAFRLNPPMNNGKDHLILELNPHSYTFHIENPSKLVELKRIVEQIYSLRNQGKSIESVKPNFKKSFSPELFSLAKGRFKDKVELKNYCESLLKQGCASGRVDGFYWSYVRQNPEINDDMIKVVEPPKVIDISTMIDNNFGHMNRKF